MFLSSAWSRVEDCPDFEEGLGELFVLLIDDLKYSPTWSCISIPGRSWIGLHSEDRRGVLRLEEGIGSIEARFAPKFSPI